MMAQNWLCDSQTVNKKVNNVSETNTIDDKLERLSDNCKFETEQLKLTF